MIVILYFIFAVFFYGWVMSVLFTYMPKRAFYKIPFTKKIFHDFCGWHYPDPDRVIWCGGYVMSAVCDICGKPILQDSQGNWY